ncbi:MAG TPA: hypothetical protein HPP59_04510, partial [Deltaproteobacteria bacterium]|nr:hypothetical protein [Deltaproteobacteria bacterium]
MIFPNDERGKNIGVNRGHTVPCFVLCFLMLIAFFACGTPVSESDSWNELLKRQHQELLETKKSVDRLASNLPERLTNLQKRLYLLRSRFEKLMLYFDFKSGNPLVLRDIKGVLEWFEKEAEQLRLPLEQEKASVDRLRESLSDLSRKLNQEGNPLMEQAERARLHMDATVKAYLKDLDSLQAKLQPLSLYLTQGLEAVDAFVLVLKKNQADIEKESNQVLETHLLKRAPGFFSATAWSAGLNSARKWASRFGMYLLEPVDLKGLSWWVLLGKIVFFSLALMGMSAVFLKRMKKRFKRLSADVQLFPSFLCFSIGAGTLLAISSTGLFPSSFFYTA